MGNKHSDQTPVNKLPVNKSIKNTLSARTQILFHGKNALKHGRNGRWLAVEGLLSSGTDINSTDSDGNSLLHHAVRQGDIEAVLMLLAMGSLASEDQQEDIAARMTPSRGILPSVKDRRSISVDSADDWVHIASDCIEMTTVKYSPALPQVNTETEQRLTLNLNARDRHGQSALMHAASRGEADIVRLLLERGADIYICDKDGRGALHWAVRRQLDNPTDLNIIAALINHGLNINSPDNTGNTIMHLAIQHNSVSHGSNVFQYLLSEGAALNARNSTGQTFLHKALTPSSRWSPSDRGIEAERSVQKIEGVNPLVVDLSLKTAFDYVTCEECQSKAKRVITVQNGGQIARRFRSTVFTDATSESELWTLRYIFSRPSALMSVTHGPFSENILDLWYKSTCKFGRERSFHFPDCLRGDEGAWLNLGFQVDQISSFDVGIRDQRGRTFLHLVVLSIYGDIGLSDIHSSYRGFPQSITTNWNSRISRVANVKDCYGQTAMHYLARLARNKMLERDMDYNGTARIGLVPIRDLNAKDRFGRTALHYAAMCGSSLYNLLLDHDADPTATDIYGETPTELAEAYRAYSRDRHFACFKKDILYKFNVVTAKLIGAAQPRAENCITFPSNAEEATFSDGFVGGIINPIHFLADIWSTMPSPYGPSGEHVLFYIARKLNDFIKRLFAAVQIIDPRLAARVMPVGSAFEKTKIAVPDEFDLNIELMEFSRICEVSSSPVCPQGYVLLRRNKAGSDKSLDEFFDANVLLKISNVRMLFEKITKHVLKQPEFWKHEDLFLLDIAEDRELYRENPTRVCVTFKLIFNKPINGIHVFHPISVDIAPCIHISGYWPNNATQSCAEGLRSKGCMLMFDQPQRIYPWIPVSIPYARISFARAESSVIRSCSVVAKAAFMVAKHLIEGCRVLRWQKGATYYSTHVVKLAVLHCVSSAARDKMKRSSRFSTDFDTLTETELKGFTRGLFHCMLQCHHQGYVPSRFLPSLSLPTWKMERFLRDFAVRSNAYRASMKSMTKEYFDGCIRKRFAEQLMGKLLDSTDAVSPLFGAHTMAHALYWMCAEDEGSPVRLLNFLDVVANPLVEYCDEVTLLNDIREQYPA